jgi:hypothetical protein
MKKEQPTESLISEPLRGTESSSRESLSDGSKRLPYLLFFSLDIQKVNAKMINLSGGLGRGS